MTSSMPFVLRVAAGVVAESLAALRRLPSEITTLPVTVLGQAAKVSFQLNQQLAELATSGDRLLAGLRSNDSPERTSWSTIDEEDEVAAADPQAAPAWDDAAEAAEDDPIADLADISARRAGRGSRGSAGPRGATRPGAAGSSGTRTGTTRATGPRTRGPKPASGVGVADFGGSGSGDGAADARTQAVIDGIEAVEAPVFDTSPRPATGTLSQLRAHVRTMSESELRDALEFEQQHKARPAHLTLLSNRLATLNHQQSE